MDREAKLAIYEALVAGSKDLAMKGKASSYTSMNGNMFSFLAPDGTLAFRLSDEDRAAYEAAHGPSEVTQYGAVMRGYVEVREGLLEDADAVRDWFARSVAHAKTLKAKPTKR